jgi:histidinol dehydrogenase
MIPIYVNPPREKWKELTARATFSDDEITATVEGILESVHTEGDRALERLTLQIEGRTEGGLVVSEDEKAEAAGLVSTELKDALDVAVHNIRRFHQAQRPTDVDIEVSSGVRCVQRAVAIQRVGLYVPGGSAPLFSTVLMLAIPAQVAGCPEIMLCTPADKDGRVAPAVLYAARLCGVEHIYKVGGAQAIAAMAYGTETIPRVDKIFGPGNRYVTRAKQLLSASTVAVDMPAGPSEVLVLADGGAPAAFAAADMLSQAEHGGDSQAVLVCSDEGFACEVLAAVKQQSMGLSRAETTVKALGNSRIVVFSEREDMIDFANTYAAEHLIIQMSEPWGVAGKITAAGSMFIGPWSPESAGDYASGTNHTLPTAGWARSFSGVNIDSFMRRMTIQELSEQGLDSLARTITTMAEAEGLDAHSNAVKVRLKL